MRRPRTEIFVAIVFLCTFIPVISSVALYETIGCFRDTGNRAISTLEGQDIHLDGNYRLRKYAIYKCYRAAKKQGFQVFAVQNGGWCASSAIAATTFNKYGKSTACKNDGEGGPWANQVYYIKDYHNVGCYKDTRNRAIRTLERTDVILDGRYTSRKNAIAKCAVAAARAGYSMFAVQNGGWCAASATAHSTFAKYGQSTSCKADGQGGGWANQVYRIKAPYISIGCFKDAGNRAIPTLEGRDANLVGNYVARKQAIAKCYRAATSRGFQVFAVQNGGWCASSSTAARTYAKYGTSTACKNDGEGGPWANQVYKIKAPYETIGCFKDRRRRAIPTLEKKDAILNGRYHVRSQAIEKCYQAAKKRGFHMFAVQNGGWCASSATAATTYRKYGKSRSCRSDGEGGPWANQVYYINY